MEQNTQKSEAVHGVCHASNGLAGPVTRVVWEFPQSLQTLVDAGCGDMVVELVAAFRTDTLERLQQAKRFAEEGNVPLFKRHMHSLKGSARQMGADQFGWMCEQNEYASADCLASEMPSRYRELVAAWEEVLPRLDTWLAHSSGK